KNLRTITNDPWFIRNLNEPKELLISRLQNHIKSMTESFYKSTHKSTGSTHYHLLSRYRKTTPIPPKIKTYS
ncbi:Reverse transcriptase domain-containing protein, partial [Aphis craccivora]